jgi:hypothetical protein
MRIVSDFKDYYDCIQATGQDQTLVYVRKPKLVKLGAWPWPLCGAAASYWRRNDNLSFSQRMIGFCGKVYPVIIAKVVGSIPEVKSFCYTIDDVNKFMEANCKKKDLKAYYEEKHPSWTYWGFKQRAFTFKKYFEECEKVQDQSGHLFEEYPLFVANCSRDPKVRGIEYNACLKDFEFYRKIDTYTAFQELAMFWGGLAQPNRPIPDVTDKDMVTAKGFNKWSFRKEPTKKK